MAQTDIIWFTGQPGSGKTTLAKEVAKRVPRSVIIDGDNVRRIFGNSSYDEAGRRKNIELIQNMALLLQEQEMTVLVAAIAPFRDQRESLKAKTPVIEFYCQTTQLRGREKFFVSSYEPPETDFIHMNTDQPLEECVIHILNDIGVKSV